MNHRLRQESGYVVVTAIIVMSLMFSIGLAAFAIVDTQQQQSRQQRERESSFNLSEGVLTAQGVNLPASWPRSNAAGIPYPTECNNTTSTDPRCPTTTQVAASFNASDFNSALTGCAPPACRWSVRVRDNGTAGGDPLNPPSDYTTVTDTAACRDSSGALVPGPGTSPCTYDANQDNQLWVRAEGITRERRRVIVALLKLETFPESFPTTAVTAGSIDIRPNGSGQTYINTGGAPVIVRCTPAPDEPKNGGSCEGWGRPEHVSPCTECTSAPSTAPALSTGALERLRTRAAGSSSCGADGKQPCFYAPTSNNTCPTDLTGGLMFIEPTNPSVKCSYAGNTPSYNSSATPGLLIMTDGVLELSGSRTFHGIIYHTNGCTVSEGTGCADSTTPAATACETKVSVNGGFTVDGSVAIDGCGRFTIGSNGGNLVFNPNVANIPESNGVAGLVQNTWRELPANFG